MLAWILESVELLYDGLEYKGRLLKTYSSWNKGCHKYLSAKTRSQLGIQHDILQLSQSDYPCVLMDTPRRTKSCPPPPRTGRDGCRQVAPAVYTRPEGPVSNYMEGWKHSAPPSVWLKLQAPLLKLPKSCLVPPPLQFGSNLFRSSPPPFFFLCRDKTSPPPPPPV